MKSLAKWYTQAQLANFVHMLTRTCTVQNRLLMIISKLKPQPRRGLLSLYPLPPRTRDKLHTN